MFASQIRWCQKKWSRDLLTTNTSCYLDSGNWICLTCRSRRERQEQPRSHQPIPQPAMVNTMTILSKPKTKAPHNMNWKFSWRIIMNKSVILWVMFPDLLGLSLHQWKTMFIEISITSVCAMDMKLKLKKITVCALGLKENRSWNLSWTNDWYQVWKSGASAAAFVGRSCRRTKFHEQGHCQYIIHTTSTSTCLSGQKRHKLSRQL